MLVLFAVLIFIYYFAAGFYLMMQIEPSPTIEFLYIAGSACIPVWWVGSDARRSAASSVYCKGLLIGAYWPFVLPYHLLKTRGWKGLLPLLVLVASYLFSQVLVFAVYFALIEQ